MREINLNGIIGANVHELDQRVQEMKMRFDSIVSEQVDVRLSNILKEIESGAGPGNWNCWSLPVLLTINAAQHQTKWLSFWKRKH